MYDFSKFGIAVPDILLPDASVVMETWSVVACDQFTAQPEYWREAERLVGRRPSTLRLVYPEAYLKDAPADIPAIHRTMRDYRDRVLTRAVHGFVLVERETSAGTRLGLMAAIDLDKYDYTAHAQSLIRATEGTVVDRLPPRMRIREGACLESPHAMLLVDDPDESLIEPMYAAKSRVTPLYDFDLMLSGGRIRGWAIDDEDSLFAALDRLYARADGFLFAVGDGNHSIAAAKACWEEAKRALPEARQQDDPRRFALVEICNLHAPAIRFEPIHRAVFGARDAELTHDFMLYLRARGMALVQVAPKDAQVFMLDEPLGMVNAANPLLLTYLQPFLDEYALAHPGVLIDYIHDDDALNHLDACRVRLTPFGKAQLFEAVRQGGSLPKKTFSMGMARDKRYYLECRKLG